MTTYQPQPGDRVSVVRVGTDGKKAILTGTYQPSTLDDTFLLDGHPYTGSATVERLYGHLGCSQRIDPAPIDN
ncbi:hypothetical protein ACH4GZ_38595 [Streptomyces hygroscopicus]|uniref:hypothetical protein n=1 Tax=Streptomyces hygroscopicus TaxID=1912 RepID=UPI0037B2280C